MKTMTSSSHRMTTDNQGVHFFSLLSRTLLMRSRQKKDQNANERKWPQTGANGPSGMAGRRHRPERAACAAARDRAGAPKRHAAFAPVCGHLRALRLNLPCFLPEPRGAGCRIRLVAAEHPSPQQTSRQAPFFCCRSMACDASFHRHSACCANPPSSIAAPSSAPPPGPPDGTPQLASPARPGRAPGAQAAQPARQPPTASTRLHRPGCIDQAASTRPHRPWRPRPVPAQPRAIRRRASVTARAATPPARNAGRETA